MRSLDSDLAELDVDVLICGTGPAGASLACFLGSLGKARTSLPSFDTAFAMLLHPPMSSCPHIDRIVDTGIAMSLTHRRARFLTLIECSIQLLECFQPIDGLVL